MSPPTLVSVDKGGTETLLGRDNAPLKYDGKTRRVQIPSLED